MNKLNPIIFLAFLSGNVFASDYRFYINIQSLAEPPSSEELSVAAWTNAGNSRSYISPYEDWSQGLSWAVGCCDPRLDPLPTEKYPTNEINGLNLQGQSRITDLSSFSNITKINGGIHLRYTGITDLSPLKNAHVNTSSSSRFDGMGLTSLEGLNSVERVGWFHLSDNNLTNLNGLESLRSVDSFFLNDNNLSDISALSNLRSLGFAPSLLIDGNPNLQDLSPLNNLINFAGNTVSPGTRGAKFSVDNRNYDVKLAYSSEICQEILVSEKIRVVDADDNPVDPSFVCEIN